MFKDKSKSKKNTIVFGIGVLSFFSLNIVLSTFGINLSEPIIQLLGNIFG